MLGEEGGGVGVLAVEVQEVIPPRGHRHGAAGHWGIQLCMQLLQRESQSLGPVLGKIGSNLFIKNRNRLNYLNIMREAYQNAASESDTKEKLDGIFLMGPK